MATTQKTQFGTEAAFTITADSLANAGGRVSDQVDLTDASAIAADLLLVHYKVVTTASTANKGIEFWLVRGDENGTPYRDGSVAATDTGYTSGSSPFTAAQLREQMELLHVQNNTLATAQTYQGSFYIRSPGRRFSLYVYNDTGAALGTGIVIRYQAQWGYSA
jgi:hypothetical protein